MSKRVNTRGNRETQLPTIGAVRGSFAPPFGTGGGGFEYADHVASFVLAAMLAAQPPFGEEIGLVTRIDWETSGSGWKFDDLLLTCGGPEQRRVGMSCKSGTYVTSRGWDPDAVRRLWEQWTGSPPNPFRRGVDRLAVVSGALAHGVDQVWDRLLQEAIAADPALFMGRFTTGPSTKVGRTLVASLACPKSLLARAVDEPIERAQLLRHVRLWHKDLQRLDSADTTQAVEWCRQSLADGSRTTALALHDALRSLAADRRIRGGTLKLVEFVRELSGKFEFNTWQNHEAGWRTLDTRSGERVDAVGDSIGETVCLTRTEVMDELIAQSKPGQVVLVEGESGSGKSALVKRLAGRFTRNLWLDPADLEAPTLQDVGTNLGLAAPLLELVGEGLRLTLGSSLGLNLGPLVELDQRLLDMSEFALQKEPLDDRRSCRFPSEFDSLTLERLSVRVAAHADESQAMTIWARLQPLLPQHADWCETFFGYWFTQPRDCLEHVERFHRRWRAMIRSVSSSFQWNPENASHFPHLGRAWSALLGVLPDGTSLGLEVDQPHLAQLEPYYQEWASWGLLDRRQF